MGTDDSGGRRGPRRPSRPRAGTRHGSSAGLATDYQGLSDAVLAGRRSGISGPGGISTGSARSRRSSTFPIAELLVPTGHFEVQSLQDLLVAKGAFRGLVVFISVLANGELAPMECPQFTRLLIPAAGTVLSLRREVDFSCRSAENEFVLIYPHETGPTAQRIIARLKERLYDLQLRSLGSFSARFIWGAAESAARRPLVRPVGPSARAGPGFPESPRCGLEPRSGHALTALSHTVFTLRFRSPRLLLVLLLADSLGLLFLGLHEAAPAAPRGSASASAGRS